tara:strand:- start:432 stop:779 length:348 start_codon:yes stop_codon:yes gene_type:complete
MIPTLRTLTRKSKLGFGTYKDFTVQQALDMPQHVVLISAYYHYTSINYTEDILNELKITKDLRIKKPSSNKEMYYNFLEKEGDEKEIRGQGPDKLKSRTQSFTGSKLQSMNHGRR